MNVQVLTDEKNALFKRRELTARLGYDNKTPKRLEIRKELAKKLGAKEELIVVNRIKPDYGTPAARLEFNIYDDEKALKELEGEHVLKRHAPKKKEGEAPAEEEEEKKEEKAGEKKEEAKEETKEEKK